MEQNREPAAVTRGQNVLYVLPHDWASIAQFLAPALDRVDETVHEVQLLVVTPDAEGASAVARAAVKLAGSRPITPMAATSARRAARVLRARTPQLVAGTPDDLLALVKEAVLKLDRVRVAILAWADELPAGEAAASFEALMAELPKEAPRTVVASAVGPAVEELIERYARRARRMGATVADAAESDLPTDIEYVTVSASARGAALRRLLDEVDPASAVVYARDEDSEREARQTLRALGYGEDGAVRVAPAAGAEDVDAVILFDFPATRAELRDVLGPRARRVIALVMPRQLASLRALAAGGTTTPLTLAQAGVRARAREAAMRAELRGVLESREYARELLALEPLLDDFDGIEIAAAALRLLERRGGGGEKRRAEPAAAAVPAGGGGGGARLFVNVGAKDNARAGDLVGAIINEAGVPREAIGRIEIRDSHSLVELTPNVADEVATRLTGTMIRGRRVQARIDQERPGRGSGGARGGPPRGGPPRGGPARGGDRPRGPRGTGERGARGTGARVAGGRREREPRAGEARPRRESGRDRE